LADRIPSLYIQKKIDSIELSSRYLWIIDNVVFQLGLDDNPNTNHGYRYNFDDEDTNHAGLEGFYQYKQTVTTPGKFLFNNAPLYFDNHTWEMFQNECISLRKFNRTISEYDLFQAGAVATRKRQVEEWFPDIPCHNRRDPHDPKTILRNQRRKQNQDIKNHPGYTIRVSGATPPVFMVWDFERVKTRYLAKVPLSNWDRQQFDDRKEMKEHCKWMPSISKFMNWDWRRQVLIVDHWPFVVFDIDEKYEDVYAIIKEKKLWKWANDKEVLLTRSFSGNTHIFIRLDLTWLQVEGLTLDDKLKKYADPKEWHRYYKYTKRYQVLKEYRERLAYGLAQDTGIKIDSVCLKNETIAYRPEEISQVNAFFEGKKPTYSPLRELPIIPEKTIEVDVAIQTCQENHGINLYQVEKLQSFINEFRRFLDNKELAAKEVMQHVENCLNATPGKTEYYKKSINILNLHFNLIVDHWHKNVDNLWPMRSKSNEIGLAKAEFNSKYFGLPTEKYSTYFRQIFCYMASLALETQYIKGKRTNDYRYFKCDRSFFSNELLEHGWREDNYSMYSNVTAPTLAALLGNGHTFTVLTKCVAPIMIQYGREEAQKIINSAILASTANDKIDRIRFVNNKIKWLHKTLSENPSVHKRRQEDQGVRSEGPRERHLSGIGLQHNQCSGGEGCRPEDVRQSICSPMLQTCLSGDSKAQENREALSSSQSFFEQIKILRPDLYLVPKS
jgi:hypothetical protein